MKSILNISLFKALPVVALFFFLTAAVAPAHEGDPMNDETKQQIAAMVDEKVGAVFHDAHAPGAAVLVSIGDETIFAQGYGVRSLASGAANTPDTNFRLASMTKQFTSAAILRLVDRGDLKLDTALTDIFDDFPPYGDLVTIRHLLTHTHGIKDYEDLMDPTIYANAAEFIQIRDEGVLALLREQTALDFEPGEKYAYSNSGYAVLAMIIEEVSGKSYPDFLEDEFFEPLAMNDTVAFVDGESDVARRAYGHRANDASGEMELNDQSSTSAVLGDGGVYTSVEDYAKWVEAWFEGDVLPDELREMAWAPAMLNDGSEVAEYGMGWRRMMVEGHQAIGHTGSTRGFNNAGYFIPEHRILVVLLSNRNGPEPPELVESLLTEIVSEHLPTQ